MLLPAFLLLGVAVALVLIRTITEPLGKLIEGTSAVAAGDLSHRVSQESQNEFGDVARKFNLMVTKLEETTVSKEELVLSEEELRQANAGLCKEIDDRRRVEKALGTSEERYRELFENASDIVYTLDLAGRITSLNKAGEQATGYTRAEALTMDIKQIVAPEDLQQVRKMMKQGNDRRGGSPTYDFKIVTKDGRPLVLEVSARPIVQDGKPVGMQGIARDVTERKQLEAQFRQAQKMEAVGRLAGGVAHDFNNLLMVVRGYSELSLARLGPHESLRTNLEEIQKAADRAASLTQQLLAFSRQQVLQPKVLDLNTVVTDAEKMLRRLIGEDIEVVAELAPELGPVMSDPGRIEQIILNLAVNGRDAMPQGGRLTLKTSNVTLDEAFARGHVGARPGPHVLLAVSDTGTGMDAETRSHVFEPFFTTKGVDKGTGLGLSTVYGIVKQSGGFIRVDSAPGRGTTFEIYLPLVEKVAAGEEIPSALLAPPPGGTETILVVEDELSVRKLGANFLASSGYTVLEAPDGGAALKVCEKHRGHIHLLMTDLVMPGMSGRELAVRLAGQRPELKVIYVSGYTDDNVVPHGVWEEEIAFLPKPFSLHELAHKVREALESGEEFRPAGFLDRSGGVGGWRNHPSVPGRVRSMVKKERWKDGTRVPHPGNPGQVPRLAGGGRSKHCHVVFPHPFLPPWRVMRSYEGRAGKDGPPAKSDPGLCLRYRFHSNFHVKYSMVAMCQMDMVLTLLKGLAAHLFSRVSAQASSCSTGPFDPGSGSGG